MMATSPMESLSSGFIINIELFFITLLLALPLGLVITFCSMSKFKPLKWLSRTFVWIIRGTPDFPGEELLRSLLCYPQYRLHSPHK